MAGRNWHRANQDTVLFQCETCHEILTIKRRHAALTDIRCRCFRDALKSLDATMSDIAWPGPTSPKSEQ